jgi:hypothetical protein
MSLFLKEKQKQNVHENNKIDQKYNVYIINVVAGNGQLPEGYPANLAQLWEALESTWANIPVCPHTHSLLHPYTYSPSSTLPLHTHSYIHTHALTMV